MVRLAKKRVVFAWLFVVGAALALGASPAAADVQHVVARGHTIEAIAHRYHVTVKAIVDANHLRDTRHLKIGETLIIPGVSAKPSAASGPGAKGALAAGAKGSTAHPASYAMRPKTPGVVHATRLATNEDFTVRVSSRRGHVAPTALKSFERMMRSTSGFTHPPDPRLIALIGQVANHFGSRKLEVISGFRPYTPTQYTAPTRCCGTTARPSTTSEWATTPTAPSCISTSATPQRPGSTIRSQASRPATTRPAWTQTRGRATWPRRSSPRRPHGRGRLRLRRCRRLESTRGPLPSCLVPYLKELPRLPRFRRHPARILAFPRAQPSQQPPPQRRWLLRHRRRRPHPPSPRRQGRADPTRSSLISVLSRPRRVSGSVATRTPQGPIAVRVGRERPSLGW